METINNIAERTRELIDGPEQEINVIKFDPMTIMVIIGVLISLIKMLKTCFPDPEPAALDTLKKPRLFHYNKIRRLVRAECKAKGLRYDGEIYNAVLKTKNVITQDDLVKAYGEVN